jgi:hypothetical protein
MKRPPLSEAWDNKLWGALWGVAMIVMVLASIGALLDGWTLDRGLVIGLIAGPGGLASLTFLGLLCWVFGLGFDEYSS